jgi:hypothetical protein
LPTFTHAIHARPAGPGPGRQAVTRRSRPHPAIHHPAVHANAAAAEPGSPCWLVAPTHAWGCLRLRPGGRRGGLQARHGGKVRTYVRRSAELCKHAIAMANWRCARLALWHAAANGNQLLGCRQSMSGEMQRPCMSAAGWVPAAPARRRSQCVSLRHHGLMAPLPVSVNPLSRWAVRV